MQATPTILVVEDEQTLGELFETWLEPDYDVRLANDGEQALEQLDDEVDMALLDRRMPGMPGGNVLERIRERGFEFPVAMVTGVDPDFDIVEMDIDDYLVKPVEREELRSLVETLVSLPTYEDALQQYFQLASKKAALETSKSDTELDSSEEYTALLEEYTRAKRRADTEAATMAGDLSFSEFGNESGF